MSSHLPSSVAVADAIAVADDFHPRYDVKYKEYVYKIWSSPIRDPFLCGFAYHYPLALADDALDRMERAAMNFVGEHDFASFMAQGSKIVTTVRNVKYSRVVQNGNLICFYVAADGFLYNMVRIMAGTLLEVGKGKISPDEIPGIIEAKNRNAAGPTAPACGLYLNKVVY